MTLLPELYQLSLLTSNVLCTTVFGEMLIFQTVVMPGLALLDDGAFLRAFQVIDGIIQGNQPVFVATWIGSVIVLLATAVMGTFLDDDDDISSSHTVGLWMAVLAYLAGQASTVTKNIPRNNRVKALDISSLDSFAKKREREYFEGAWNGWHLFRTILFGLVSLDLMWITLQTNSTF